MLTKRIYFTKPNVAELLDFEYPVCGDNQVIAKVEYTTVSGGTERACIMGAPNTYTALVGFPTYQGYCGVGRIVETGKNVTAVKVGDRALLYHGGHATYNLIQEDKVYKIDDEEIDSLDAAMVIIAAMGLGGVRKLQLELGESAMVIGLGLLGMFSVQFLRQSGANPVIAVDFSEERRKLALQLGADYAFSPAEENFIEKVKAVTRGKGVNAIVEVTGSAKALQTALDCVGYTGRISLLGCTRISDTPIDFYQQVHKPGVKLIGAHNAVRPKIESYPYHWTNHDDCVAILDMIKRGRIQVKPMISRVVSPKDAPRIYTELVENKDFPMGTIFDWGSLDKE